MSAYIIGTITVTDPSWVESYIPNVQAQVEAAGGRYLSRGEPAHLEGAAGQPSVAVIIEFADKDTARLVRLVGIRPLPQSPPRRLHRRSIPARRPIAATPNHLSSGLWSLVSGL